MKEHVFDTIIKIESVVFFLILIIFVFFRVIAYKKKKTIHLSGIEKSMEMEISDNKRINKIIKYFCVKEIILDPSLYLFIFLVTSIMMTIFIHDLFEEKSITISKIIESKNISEAIVCMLIIIYTIYKKIKKYKNGKIKKLRNAITISLFLWSTAFALIREIIT